MIRALLCLCAVFAAQTVTAESLRIGTEPDYRPYIFKAEDGTHAGFDVELMTQICAQGGFDCVWIDVAFDQLFTGVAEGLFDVAVGGIGDNPERNLLVDWTTPYRKSDGSLAYFAGLRDDIDLSTARISVQGGTTQETVLRDEGYFPVIFASQTAALDALFDGTVDVFFSSSSHLSQLVANGETRLIELDSINYDSGGPQIAVSKGKPELRARLDQILDAMTLDGRLSVLNAKWFPDETETDT